MYVFTWCHVHLSLTVQGRGGQFPDTGHAGPAHSHKIVYISYTLIVYIKTLFYRFLTLVVHYRGGVGNFQVQDHAGLALNKMDELFNNDKILAFQTPKGDLGSKSGGKGTPGMSLPAQKALAWAAVHLLIFLEKECQHMARQVIVSSKIDFLHHLKSTHPNPFIQSVLKTVLSHNVCTFSAYDMQIAQGQRPYILYKCQQMAHILMSFGTFCCGTKAGEVVA